MLIISMQAPDSLIEYASTNKINLIMLGETTADNFYFDNVDT